MPTGYTAGVQDGSITSFPEYAMRCARAFGALVLMRDDPLDAPIPESFPPSDYAIQSVQTTEIELGRLLLLSSDEADTGAREAHEASVRHRDEYRAKRKRERERYEAMLAMVKAWKPPSADHEGLAKFMVEQLTQSIDFDCGDYEPTVEPLLSGTDWQAQQIAQVSQRLERARQSLHEEENRARGRTKWLRELRESLR